MYMDKSKLTVNMSGDTYIEYLKYKDSKKKTLKLGTIIILSSLIIGTIIIAALYSSLTYVQPPKTVYSWNGILMFMGVAAGVGWIIHGTGFLLVRR